jgi:hypothetical protein
LPFGRVDIDLRRLGLRCVTSDQMKATSFTYELGAEIPEAKWEDLGLWQ